jgi:ATP-dependent RNA helicase DeaD
MTTFKDLGVAESILSALDKIGFTTPTPIQEQAIPPALEGCDILGSAQTGTGKTAAFGIPLISRLIANPTGMAIVMTPTRELAAQVLSTLHPLLLNHRAIKTALLIGGDSMGRQLDQLRQRPRIIVGTPGRINDHLERRSLNLADAGFLVLDEMDRMLDMGFGVQIDRILKFMPRQRQTLMFSATIPAAIVKVSQKYLVNPKRIAIGSANTPLPKIKQENVPVTEGDKYNQLTGQLYQRQGSILVFVKTKHGAKRLAEKLSRDDHKADAIHGNLAQNKRTKVIDAFRQKKYRVLVATDVAARGLDIPHIEHVINYDLPQCPEDYIHRIGRTARAGAEGNAINLLAPSDSQKWREICKLMNPGEKMPDEPRGQRRDEGRKQPSRYKRSRNFRHSRGNQSGERQQAYR